MEAAGGRAEHGDGMDAVVVTSTDRTTAEKGEGRREREGAVRSLNSKFEHQRPPKQNNRVLDFLVK